MQLNFEVVKEVGTGSYPDLIHFANTQAQIFNIDDGKLNGMPSDKIDNGDWDDVTFQDEADVSPDEGMSHFEIKVLPGFGIVGGYKTGDTHKLIIYEFAFEMDAYLNSGSIKHSIDNPISSFSLSLENPDLKDPENQAMLQSPNRIHCSHQGRKFCLYLAQATMSLNSIWEHFT